MRNLIWLSHILDENTPTYGGEGAWQCLKDKNIQKGDSCNTSLLKLHSHTGTHVDAPMHFVKSGAGIENYSPEEWVFTHPELVFIDPKRAGLITPDDLNITRNDYTDMILICTSFEKLRDEDVYWKENPGIAPETADFLLDQCSNLKIIGMNFISISSYCHRNIGRISHRAFLEKGIRIIEDMHLLALKPGDRLRRVIVLPLRFKDGDGAPCTVIGQRLERS